MWTPSVGTVALSSVVGGAGALCLLRDYLSGPAYDRACSVRLEGRVALVTGASSGIGRETALELARRGARVFMACRDLEACERERRDIVLEARNKYVYCRRCDLASLASVRECAARMRREEPALHLLVLNAGVMRLPRRALSADGVEMHLAVNHLGHYLLARELAPLLEAGAPARVVVVTSAEHRRGSLRTHDINWEGEYEPGAAYAQSKLCNVLFAGELSRRLLQRGVSVVSVCPGRAATRLERHLPLSSSVSRFLLWPILWPLSKSARMAAQSVLHAALDPKLHALSGEYFEGMEVGRSSEAAQQVPLQAWLWQLSDRWTRPPPPPPPDTPGDTPPDTPAVTSAPPASN